jgi:hypothetical protein
MEGTMPKPKKQKTRKKRKYIQLDNVNTKVQWGKRGGDLRIVVSIPRKHLEERWAKERKPK